MNTDREWLTGPAPEQDTEPTIVVFRKFPKSEGGQIVALFPEVPWANYGECSAYMHIGQHSAASPQLVYRTRAATPAEYAPLLAELAELGYLPAVRQKCTRKMFEKCEAARQAYQKSLQEASNK